MIPFWASTRNLQLPAILRCGGHYFRERHCRSSGNVFTSHPTLQFMNQPNRRKVLCDLATVAAWGSVAAVGCVPAVQGPLPDLVWGRRGMSEGRFLKPRAITIDDQDRLYIFDTTGLIQVFDTDGNFIRFWSTPETKNGRPTGLAIQSSKNDSLKAESKSEV